ncbi:hypothetical protein R3I94_014571 [Phoxinus phoxinus]|uniref:Uncharacterized protein n=1 Tax=Phoxinus phoxinus TaxID=58324 RepID=A0AAN9CSR2_9TELE
MNSRIPLTWDLLHAAQKPGANERGSTAPVLGSADCCLESKVWHEEALIIHLHLWQPHYGPPSPNVCSARRDHGMIRYKTTLSFTPPTMSSIQVTDIAAAV